MKKLINCIKLSAVLAFSCTIIQAKPHVQQVSLPDGATETQIIKAAANVVPSPRQLGWQEMEFYGFVHFGPNTFNGVEWGNGKEDPACFNPTALDAEQWARAAKAAGMKMLMITVKHHDGFCLWQTRYTNHSVKSSPWKKGKGDVLRELSKACRKYGLKLGVYLSPADLYQIENPKGLYGNGSNYTQRVIPRQVSGRPFKKRLKFKYSLDDYNEYMMNQLFELLTEYGPIYEVWFDGANPKQKGNQSYAYEHWFEMIRKLAPKATIAIMGPDVRWCGNEAGHNRPSEWSVIPIYEKGLTLKQRFSDRREQDHGSREKLKNAVELMWFPSEVDTSIRHGWFYRDENQHVRSVENLLDIWFGSVGGNSTLLLNMTPDKRGLIPDKDVAHLAEVGRVVKETFAVNLAQNAKIVASQESDKRFSLKNTVDGSTYSCWKPKRNVESATVALNLDGPKTFDCFMIQENIRDFGQRIETFALDAFVDGTWKEIAVSGTVGYKRILRFAVVTTERVRVRILKSRICPTISNIGLYKLAEVNKNLDITVDHSVKTISSDKWKVIGLGKNIRNIIDSNEKTYGIVKGNEIIIDLGRALTIPGFTYLPRQDGKLKGIIDNYQFYVSNSTEKWGDPVKKGRFQNIKNSPVNQVVRFPKPIKGRYIKLKAVDLLGGASNMAVAEIGVLKN